MNTVKQVQSSAAVVLKNQFGRGHGWGVNLAKGRVLVESKESVYRESFSTGVSFGHGRCFYNEHVGTCGQDSESEDEESK
jgi:hypothetical protein